VIPAPSPAPPPDGPPALDPVIHEAVRLRMVAVLNECEAADFNFLLGTLALTRGNLSVHMAKLVGAGYVEEKKEFVERKPHTEYRLSAAGRAAYKQYLKDWKRLTGT
jgi:DNA-binding transcriptional ArsR family regulator